MAMQAMKNMVNQMLAPLRNRVYGIVTRAVIEAAKDTNNMQLVKLALLAGENRDDVERFQNFGFSSVPPDGSEALALAVGGNRDHLIVVAADDRRVRVKGLAKGEAVIFTDDGTKIHLKKGGLVDVVAATKVLVTCPEVEMSGNLTVKQNLKVEGTSQQDGKITAGNDIEASGTITGADIVSNGGVTAASGTVSGQNISTTGGTDLDDFKDTYNSHTHNENGDGGGITDSPNQTV